MRERAFDHVERGEVRATRCARFDEPATQAARILKRRDTARARQRQRDQMIRRAMCDERGLQSSLLPQVEGEQKIDFHKGLSVVGSQLSVV